MARGWTAFANRALRGAALLSLALGCPAMGSMQPQPVSPAQDPATLEAPPAFRPLQVGDAAPSLDGTQHVSGPVVEAFAPGTITVVDFWATWCLPCHANLPVLTAIAKDFAAQRVQVLGVAIWEGERPMEEGDPSHFERVKRFVQAKGEEMAFSQRYGSDSPAFLNRWMTAAERTSIPTVFVIDREQRIAWIGHPAMGLREVIERMVAGTFDAQAEAQRIREQEDNRTKGMRMAATAQRHVQAKEWDQAIDVFGKMLRLDPMTFSPAAASTLRILLIEKRDAKAAAAYSADALAGPLAGQLSAMRGMAQVWLDAPQELHNVTMALALAEQASRIAPDSDWQTHWAYARALKAAGRVDEAIFQGERALPLADNQVAPQIRVELQRWKSQEPAGEGK